MKRAVRSIEAETCLALVAEPGDHHLRLARVAGTWVMAWVEPAIWWLYGSTLADGALSTETVITTTRETARATAECERFRHTR